VLRHTCWGCFWQNDLLFTQSHDINIEDDILAQLPALGWRVDEKAEAPISRGARGYKCSQKGKSGGSIRRLRSKA